MKVRNRPNWLLLSLVAMSVAIAEVLPFFWAHLFMSGSSYSYIASNIVICVSQVGPTLVMPIFHLEISGRFTWLVRFFMWLSLPVTLIPAYALHQFRRWRKRGQPTRIDGLLPPNELIEFIHLHETSSGFGGMVNDHVGKAMRSLLEEQIAMEVSSRNVETESSCSIPLRANVALSSVQSLQEEVHQVHHEGSTSNDDSISLESTNIRLHRQEGSTAIEEVPTPGLRKRGERSTEGYESVASKVSMQIPQQALIKEPIHGSPTLVNNRYMGVGAPNGLPLRRNYAFGILAIR